MFEPTAGRLQLDIHSLLANIYTDRYFGNEGIYIAHNSSYLSNSYIGTQVTRTCNGHGNYLSDTGWTVCTGQPGEEYDVTPAILSSSIRLTCTGSCPMLPSGFDYRGIREIQIWP